MSCEERIRLPVEVLYQASGRYAQNRRAETRHRVATIALMILMFTEVAAIVWTSVYYSPGVQVSRSIKKAEELVRQEEYEKAIETYIETLEIKYTDRAQEGLTNACLTYADLLFGQENFQMAKVYYNFVFLYDENNERAYLGILACEQEERKKLREKYQEMLE